MSSKRLYLAFIHRYSLQKFTDQQRQLEEVRAQGDRRIHPAPKLRHKKKKKGKYPVDDSSKRVIIPWRRPARKDLEKKDECDDDYKFPKVEGDNGSWEEIDSDDEEKRKAKRNKIPLRPLSKNDDVSSLVFIARVGNVDNPGTCVLMDWEYFGTENGECGKKLVIDYHRNRDIWKGGFSFPTTFSDDDGVAKVLETSVMGDDWDEEIDKILQESPLWRITLHAVDVKEYKVISLMDATSVGRYGVDAGLDLCIRGYGSDLPNVYGIPPTDSPYSQKYTEDDYPINGYRDPDESPGIDIFEISAGINIKFYYYGEGGDEKEEEEDGDDEDRRFCPKNMHMQMFPQFLDGLHFHFHMYGQSAIYICSFFRAMIKQKCVALRGQIPMIAGNDAPLALSQQPGWIQTEEILDRVLSYASFEDQVGKLRLVSRQFQASALRQLEQKLDKTKVIAEDGGWFNATVRRGWSNNDLTSEEDAVDLALWYTSCRCGYQKCDSKESCPSAGKPIEYSDHGTTKTLDLDTARRKLAKTGTLTLTRPDEWEMEHECYHSDGAESSFELKSMSLYKLCGEVNNTIKGKLGPRVLLNRSLKRYYGVGGNIRSKRFVRSIFLVFTKAKAFVDSSGCENEGATKKARAASIDEVTIGMAKACVTLDTGGYSRMKKIFRFYSAAGEPIEIDIESKTSYRSDY